MDRPCSSLNYGYASNARMIARLSLRTSVSVIVIGAELESPSLRMRTRGTTHALVEQHDFAAGDEPPTRIIHGGLRHLEHGDIG